MSRLESIRERDMEVIQHHGVKGMKWGVRRYQPYTDGGKGSFLGKLTGKDGKAKEKSKEKTSEKQSNKSPNKVYASEAHRMISEQRARDPEQSKKYSKEIETPTKTLTDRFKAAQKDNPKLNYTTIYNSQVAKDAVKGSGLSEEDTSYYKIMEDAWLKKHGY